ncbi:MAG: hypothetical protein AAF370_06960, partial [Pseudomonadota bacterium]
MMENFSAGLEPSDLLFGDELLNVPLELAEAAGNATIHSGPIVVENMKNDADNDQMSIFDVLGDNDDQTTGHDLLKEVMEEVKLEPGNMTVDDQDAIVTTYVLDDATMELEQAGTPVAEEEETNDTESLIEEMETFLTSHETKEEPEEPAEPHPLTEAETTQAEQLLDALMNGTISMD